MEKYRFVGEKKSELRTESADKSGDNKTSNDECEVRITQQGKPRNYISYAMSMLVSI
jgi:hypothetical protein